MESFLDFNVFPIIPTSDLIQSAEGGNARHLLVVAEEDSFSEESKEFLRKVFTAVKYSLGEDALFLNTNNEKTWRLMDFCHKIEGKINTIVLFGTNPKILNVKLTPYLPIKIKDQTILWADKVSSIQEDVTLKKKLWSALQLTFL